MRLSTRALARLLPYVCILVSIASTASAQNPDAVTHARSGFQLEQQKRYNEALYEYNASIAIDKTYPYPVARIGGMYQLLHNYPLAIQFYDQAIKLDSSYDVYNYFNLGLSFRIVQKHDSAVLAMRQFLQRMNPVNAQDTSAMHDADFWIKFNLGCLAEKAKPKNTDAPTALANLNSKYDDFGPSITADGSTLYFTSRRQGTNLKQMIETADYGDDVFYARLGPNGKWETPFLLPTPLNSNDDEGAATITADGQTLYFSLCRRPDGLGDCDLYRADLIGEDWTKPSNLGRSINSVAWDGQPSISADGSTMFFCSRRQGSIDGSEDIYVAYHNTDGTWTPPKNLGEPVNTRFSERSPFIAADGKTLYFASNGHPGFGNHDLFMTKKLDDGTWSVPINLGAPINAYGDDVFMTIPARGDKIVYSSQRENAQSDLDLYEAKLPPEFRPGPVTVVAGTVFDANTKKPIGAEVDVNDLVKDERVAVYRANRVTGKFYITLGTGKTYGVTATAPGYVFYSENYTVPDTISYREWTHDIYLQPLPDSLLAANTKPGKPGTTPNNNRPNSERPAIDTSKTTKPSEIDNRFHPEGQPTRLNNIFFDFNKTVLKQESQTELRYLTNLLKHNDKLKIDISGHTDNVGSDSANLVLSAGRANAVRDYLIGQGIEPTRITAHGYGERVPLVSNDTDEGRMKNRRVEFRLHY
jgi:outer membrane protein OmpA-like peptidoglycan-associated protein/Tol biopolymer transport system component